MVKKKRRTPLFFKLNVLLVFIILSLSGGLTLIAYRVNSERVDRDFKRSTADYADTMAALLDGEWFEGFAQQVCSPEFQALREKAVAQQDEGLIRDWLAEKNLLEDFRKASALMMDFCERMEAKYIYTLAVNGTQGVNLIDPAESLLYVGSPTPPLGQYLSYQENGRISSYVSVTDYGWLCSAYDPIENAKGDYVGYVGVDMDMSNAMREQRQFLMKMVVFAAILLVVSLMACVFQLRKICTVPLEMLAEATRGFADSDHGFTKENIINLPITANDEIGDLYQVIRSMQIKIVQYLDNLTRVTAEKERISAELNIAAQIQEDMLPRSFPPFPERHDFDIYATMDPAKEVGGDFYDFFLIDADHLALVMADVSGKGVPASLFMVNTKTLIKNRAMMGGSPAEILDYVNRQLCEGNEAEMFVTVWLAIVELSTGKGMAANAGHEHPTIRHRDGRYELVIYRHSLAVATLEGLRFREHSFELKPGDSLFVYTDGVTEATDAENRLFGTERMLEALNREPDADPKTLLGNVKTEIDAFVGSAPQFDDITMLCMQYNGPEETA